MSHHSRIDVLHEYIGKLGHDRWQAEIYSHRQYALRTGMVSTADDPCEPALLVSILCGQFVHNAKLGPYFETAKKKNRIVGPVPRVLIQLYDVLRIVLSRFYVALFGALEVLNFASLLEF